MPFTYHTPFPATDPNTVPHFTRTFDHKPWVDGTSIVQAEATPTEEGFNSRFRKIMADFDALGADSRQALAAAAALRTSLFNLLAEVQSELNRLGDPGLGWQALTLLSAWQSATPVEPGVSFRTPAFAKDRAGVIHLRGCVTNGRPDALNSSRLAICRLPSGYRPSGRIAALQPVEGYRALGSNLLPTTTQVRVDVDSDGHVALADPDAVPQLGNRYGDLLFLEGLSFLSE